ncbi:MULTISPECIES: hypothetical protein [unclassified Aureimonas]|uniref:hypothetical protein n=1 Tax=unclassified Aureimonas TaxID=2615206 RepID=UPI0012E3AB86|nr:MULTISPECIES: hypothetical protein [unclassified Aureimonas]
MRTYINWTAAIILAEAVTWSGLAVAAGDSEILSCRAETDSLQRLTCYDKITVAEPEPSASTRSPHSVSFVSGDLRIQSKDFEKTIYNERVEFIPTFRNAGEKTVVALMFDFTFSDAFDEEIIKQSSKVDVRIAPGKTVQSSSFFYWEDNPFIAREPFDLLSGPISAGTTKISGTVTKVVYSDGTAG